jgi:hypothetical protein
VRADAFVRGVGKRASGSGAAFDEDVVAVPNQLERAGRSQRDAVLVGLDLFRDADLHSGRTLYRGENRHAFDTAA